MVSVGGTKLSGTSAAVDSPVVGTPVVGKGTLLHLDNLVRAAVGILQAFTKGTVSKSAKVSTCPTDKSNAGVNEGEAAAYLRRPLASQAARRQTAG